MVERIIDLASIHSVLQALLYCFGSYYTYKAWRSMVWLKNLSCGNFCVVGSIDFLLSIHCTRFLTQGYEVEL